MPPRWAQRTPASPALDDDMESLVGTSDAEISPEPPLEVKGRRRGFRGKRGKAGVPGGHFDSHGTSLTITLPGQAPVGDSEERFCRCKGLSHGEVRLILTAFTEFSLSCQMVGCDNEKCEGQWVSLVLFAYSFTNLTSRLVPSRLCWFGRMSNRRDLVLLS